MNCFLIYRKEDAEKNTAYIDLFRRGCRSRGLSFSLLFHSDLFMSDSFLPSPLLFEDSFVINRTRDPRVSLFCERNGIPVWNDSRLCTLGNDKAAACRYVSSLGLPVLQTTDAPEKLDIPYPCVMKSADGHGGSEVFLLHSAEDERKYRLLFPGRQWICQEFCDTPGKDLRVYLVGHTVVGAMLRTSDTDFRANYSLGGSARPVTLTPEESTLVQAIAAPLSIGHCGIDLLFHKNKPVFNEIEDVVGSRMLYRYTDVDVVSLYLDEILKSLRT